MEIPDLRTLWILTAETQRNNKRIPEYNLRESGFQTAERFDFIAFLEYHSCIRVSQEHAKRNYFKKRNPEMKKLEGAYFFSVK